MSISHSPTVDDDMPRVLHPGALVQVILVFSVLLAFGVIHLFLRFQHDRVRQETSQLQALQSELASDVKLLQGQCEAFKNPRLLYHYAIVNMKMVPYSKDIRNHVMQIRPDVYKRYEVAKANIDAARRGTPAKPWVDQVTDRLGVIGDAVAGGEKKIKN